MAVRTSIQKPLIDQIGFLYLKYKAAKPAKAKKQITARTMLNGYEIGCFEVSLKARMVKQINALANPTAPTTDSPSETAVVFMLQLFFTALANTKQNKAEIIKAIPKRIK